MSQLSAPLLLTGRLCMLLSPRLWCRWPSASATTQLIPTATVASMVTATLTHSFRTPRKGTKHTRPEVSLGAVAGWQHRGGNGDIQGSRGRDFVLLGQSNSCPGLTQWQGGYSEADRRKDDKTLSGVHSQVYVNSEVSLTPNTA